MKLEGKRILVTGASSGIGRALAWEFARQGASLIMAARRKTVLDDVARELSSAYPRIPAPVTITCDVTDRSQVHSMVEEAVHLRGGIDVLVNNAGISVYGESAGTPVDAFHEVMDVNFFGSLHCTLEVLPHMKQANQGLIVNVASLAAIHGVPYLGAYSASKAALVAFGQSLRAELKDGGIAVMNVYPNYTHTELFEHEQQTGGAHRPQHPYASAAEVAKKIIRAIARQRRDLILSPQGKALFLLQGVWPALVEKKMQQITDELRED